MLGPEAGPWPGSPAGPFAISSARARGGPNCRVSAGVAVPGERRAGGPQVLRTGAGAGAGAGRERAPVMYGPETPKECLQFAYITSTTFAAAQSGWILGREDIDRSKEMRVCLSMESEKQKARTQTGSDE